MVEARLSPRRLVRSEANHRYCRKVDMFNSCFDCLGCLALDV